MLESQLYDSRTVIDADSIVPDVSRPQPAIQPAGSNLYRLVNRDT